jgi:hypothetical protein
VVNPESQRFRLTDQDHLTVRKVYGQDRIWLLRCRMCGEECSEALWDHTVVAADSKLVVSLVVGKRTQEQTQRLVNDAKRWLRPGPLPAIFTDAYVGYESALLEAFGRHASQPSHGSTGRVSCPVVRWPQRLAYGQVQKIYKLDMEKQAATGSIQY